MTPDHETPACEITAVAARWAARYAEGLSQAETAEFKAWLAADPRHARALAKVNRARVDCDWVWQVGAADEILVRLEAKGRQRRRRRILIGASAALVLCAVRLVWQGNQTFVPSVASDLNSKLVTISPTKQTLPDGSVVELMNDAQVLTDYSDGVRAVSLLRGTAFFEVAKDAQRPFVVRAGGLAVRAVGTAFAMELTGTEELRVLVTEGRIGVHALASETTSAMPLADAIVSVDAGSSVSLPVAAPISSPPVVSAVDEAEIRERTSWRIPKLEFSAVPLREVVAQINQHNQRRFVLGDKAVGELRVSGILSADKMDTLAEMLETDFGVYVERRSGEITLRRKR